MKIWPVIVQEFRKYYFIVIKIAVFYHVYLRQKVRIKNKALKDKLMPPYIMLANHCAHWDPLIINFRTNHLFQYVTSHSLYRSPFVGTALKLYGCIPKSKNRPESYVIRRIMQAVKYGACIGIFPEGQGSWDGETLPLIPSTAKLIKLIKIPVLIVHIEGSYFAGPRWARHIRTGITTVNFKRIISSQEIKETSSDDLLGLLTKELRYSDTERQRKEMLTYRGPARAEYLERALFACPCCLSVGSMISYEEYFRCRTCKYTVLYTEQGFFEPVNTQDNASNAKNKERKALYFDSIPAWNKWQLPYLRSFLKQKVAKTPDQPIFTEGEVLVLEGVKKQDGKLSRIGKGQFELRRDALIVHFPKQEMQIPFAEIEALNIQKYEHMEFSYLDKHYRLEFKNPRTCGYKLLLSIEFLRNLPESA